MKTFFAAMTYLFATLHVGPAVSADIVARVDLKYIEETDITAERMCYSDENCDVWALHYLWEARVRELIHGDEIERRFRVLFGRHALVKRDIKNALVVMRRLQPATPADARYEVTGHGAQRSMVCFDQASLGEAPVQYVGAGGRIQRCFLDGRSAD